MLVRLATEPPDLTGLPPDLTGVVAGCLEPEPANRPTPAALLAAFAPDMHLDADGAAVPARTGAGADGGLPAAAAGAGPAATTEDGPHARVPLGSTGSAGSSVSWSVPAPRWAAAAAGRRPAAAAPPAAPPPARRSVRRSDAARVGRRVGRRRPGPRRPGRRAIAAGRVGTRDRARPAGPSRRRGPLPGRAARGRRRRPAGRRRGAGQLAQRRRPARAARSPQAAAGPPDGREPPPPPPGRAAAGRPDRRRSSMNQPYGDGHTVFVVYGRGWPPGTRVTVALAGGRTSPDRPVVDRAGAFNYAVNQGPRVLPRRAARRARTPSVGRAARRSGPVCGSTSRSAG